jgi:hypothetical protein
MNLFAKSKILPPEEHELTLGEVETKLITLPSKPDLERYIHLGVKTIFLIQKGVLYPNVMVPTNIDPNHHKKRIRELFLTVSKEMEKEEKERESFEFLQTLAYHVPLFQILFSTPIPKSITLRSEKYPVRTQDWNSQSFILGFLF